jgi:hypothetical protein
MELGVPSAELALQYLSSSASDPAAKEPSDEAPPVDRRAGSMLDPAAVVLLRDLVVILRCFLGGRRLRFALRSLYFLAVS